MAVLGLIFLILISVAVLALIIDIWVLAASGGALARGHLVFALIFCVVFFVEVWGIAALWSNRA
jgi:hypothetical protein